MSPKNLRSMEQPLVTPWKNHGVSNKTTLKDSKCKGNALQSPQDPTLTFLTSRWVVMDGFGRLKPR